MRRQGTSKTYEYVYDSTRKFKRQAFYAIISITFASASQLTCQTSKKDLELFNLS